MARPTWVPAAVVRERDRQLARLSAPGWVPAVGDFPPEFTHREWLGASPRGLSSAALRGAWRLMYQPAGLLDVRDRVGPLRLTSFERHDDGRTGCHERGAGLAVDLVPVRTSIGRVHRIFATLNEQLDPPPYGEIMDETLAKGGPHLHLSQWPCGMTSGQPDVMRIVGFKPDGSPRWEAGAAAPIVPVVIAVGVLAIGLALVALP